MMVLLISVFSSFVNNIVWQEANIVILGAGLCIEQKTVLKRSWKTWQQYYADATTQLLSTCLLLWPLPICLVLPNRTAIRSNSPCIPFHSIHLTAVVQLVWILTHLKAQSVAFWNFIVNNLSSLKLYNK